MKKFAVKLNEPSRREFVRNLALTSLGVNAVTAFGAEDTGMPKLPIRNAPCKKVIFIYMGGGMSHLDTFDPKEDPDVKGITTPIKTSVPGVHFGNNLPQLATLAHEMCVIRGMTTSTGDHQSATYAMHTGFVERPGTSHPHFGSWAQYFLGADSKEIPASVIISRGNPGPGFFSPAHSPFPISNPEKGIRDMLPKISKSHFEKRVKLAKMFSKDFNSRYPHQHVSSYADFYDSTVKFFDGAGSQAFDLYKEPREVRDRYGRGRFAQGLCLARRLLEHGVRYVEVGYDRGWDSMHNDASLGEGLAQGMDQPIATLLRDLKCRGMLESTMVVVTTEFGRTPKLSKIGGRDHHPRAFSAMVAGGGVNGGQIVGGTNEQGTHHTGEEVNVARLHATMAYAMGLPIELRIHGSGGQPFFVGDQAAPLKSIFA
jgi:hypothetical protein